MEEYISQMCGWSILRPFCDQRKSQFKRVMVSIECTQWQETGETVEAGVIIVSLKTGAESEMCRGKTVDCPLTLSC